MVDRALSYPHEFLVVLFPSPKMLFFGRGARGEGVGPHPLPFSHRKKHSGRREQKIRGDSIAACPPFQLSKNILELHCI